MATFHWPPSRTSRVLRQLDAISSPSSFFSRRVTSETAVSADVNRRPSACASSFGLPLSVLKNSAYPFWISARPRIGSPSLRMYSPSAVQFAAIAAASRLLNAWMLSLSNLSRAALSASRSEPLSLSFLYCAAMKPTPRTATISPVTSKMLLCDIANLREERIDHHDFFGRTFRLVVGEFLALA